MKGIVKKGESKVKKVFLTTLNTDNYLIGVQVLAKNIRQYCTHELVVLVSDDLEKKTYDELKKHQIPFIIVENSRVSEEIARAVGDNIIFGHWVNTLFKLKIFELTQFEKIVYIDSDMMVQAPLDDLFEKDDMSAVIAGKSYPGNENFEELNSGIFVVCPREGLSQKLMGLVPVVAANKEYFGDQDVISEYFKEWKSQKNLHLPEEYNVFWRYYDYYSKRNPVKVVHFIGKIKPWMMTKRQVFIEYLKCILKGNFYSIKTMQKYRRYIKSVSEV